MKKSKILMFLAALLPLGLFLISVMEYYARGTSISYPIRDEYTHK